MCLFNHLVATPSFTCNDVESAEGQREPIEDMSYIHLCRRTLDKLICVYSNLQFRIFLIKKNHIQYIYIYVHFCILV